MCVCARVVSIITKDNSQFIFLDEDDQRTLDLLSLLDTFSPKKKQLPFVFIILFCLKRYLHEFIVTMDRAPVKGEEPLSYSL